jgi:hypothetical protein
MPYGERVGIFSSPLAPTARSSCGTRPKCDVFGPLLRSRTTPSPHFPLRTSISIAGRASSLPPFRMGTYVYGAGFLPSYVAGDVPQINEVIIPPRSLPPLPFAGMSHLVLDTADGTSLLVHRLDSAYFYRHNVNLATGEVETVEFGDETTGSIRSLRLTTTAQAKALPFVLAGDSQGLLNVLQLERPRARPERGFCPTRQADLSIW